MREVTANVCLTKSIFLFGYNLQNNNRIHLKLLQNVNIGKIQVSYRVKDISTIFNQTMKF